MDMRDTKLVALNMASYTKVGRFARCQLLPVMSRTQRQNEDSLTAHKREGSVADESRNYTPYVSTLHLPQKPPESCTFLAHTFLFLLPATRWQP